MNDGFMRSVRFFINNIRVSFGSFLLYPIIVCFLKWTGKIDAALCSVYMLMTALMVFALGMQHYLYFYKTSKSFSISGKNFHVTCHVNILLWSVTSTAMVWLIRCLISFYEFTPHMMGIVFLLSVLYGFLGEFCGILFFKCNSKRGVIFCILLIIVGITYAFSFAFIVFRNDAGTVAVSTDAFILASALTFPVLSVIFLTINGLMVRNLEIRS